MSDPANTISFQGMLGAYSMMACRAAYPDMTPLPCRTFNDAFEAVRSGEAALAMIPIDNSVAGRVADIHHLLPQSGLHIVGEHFQRVNHQLLAVPGTTIDELTHVHSHVHALGQVRKLVAELGVEPVVHVDTAGAAKDIAAAGVKSQGAISSELAAELYGLDILRSDVEDSEHNTTRFVVMNKQPIDPGPDQAGLVTTFVFSVRNIPASLYKAMGGFATNGVNMTKLESYVDADFNAAQFYADVEGHPEQTALKLALEELDFFTDHLHILGTYPSHDFRRRKA
ncbi:MAG: prephenate dehydratase [Rhodospirillaceae bacterium]|nr:prephenate dehydratase [Rhodospirillaceae bacterium]